MNNYEINLTQSYPDRNGMYITDFMSVNKIMQNSLTDELKKRNMKNEYI